MAGFGLRKASKNGYKWSQVHPRSPGIRVKGTFVQRMCCFTRRYFAEAYGWGKFDTLLSNLNVFIHLLITIKCTHNSKVFLFYQAFNQLEISVHVEKTALLLREDAIKVMKTALAGTATTKFLDVMEAVFGVDENHEDVPEFLPTPGDDDDVIPVEAMVTKEQTEQEDAAEELLGAVGGVSSTTATRRVTRSATTKSGSAKRKRATPHKIFDIATATPFYPTRANKKKYLHTGVDPKYIKERRTGQFSKFAFYSCNYAAELRQMGIQTAECDSFNQNMGQTSTHIRSTHLNHCMACFVCSWRTWSGEQWRQHMQKKHGDLQEDDWFVGDTFVPPTFMVKAEEASAVAIPPQ